MNFMVNAIDCVGCYYPIPFKYSKFVFYSSFSMGVAALIALYLDDGYTSIYFFLLWLTSINFWRKPAYGMRRNIDKILVYSGVLYVIYHLFILSTAFYKTMWIYVFTCVLFFHIIEHIYCYFNCVQWIVFHMAMHIYVSMMVLFCLFQ